MKKPRFGETDNGIKKNPIIQSNMPVKVLPDDIYYNRAALIVTS